MRVRVRPDAAAIGVLTAMLDDDVGAAYSIIDEGDAPDPGGMIVWLACAVLADLRREGRDDDEIRRQLERHGLHFALCGELRGA